MLRRYVAPDPVNTIRDDQTEVSLDPQTGELAVHDLVSGQTVYADLDPEMLGTMVNLINAAHVGDANASATAGFAPGEGGREEPLSAPTVGLQLGERFDTRAGSSAGPVALSGGILIRRAMPGGPGAPRRSPRSGSDAGTLGFGDTCVDWARAIGSMRVEYWASRGAAFSTFRDLPKIPAAELDWSRGYPRVGVQDLRNFLIGLGVQAAEMGRRAFMLDFSRVMYNSYGCSNPIIVQIPTGMAFVGAPAGSGGGFTRCETQIEHWEISYDGGRTWYGFNVETTVCQHAQD